MVTADVAKSADAESLNLSGSNPVQVRVLPSASKRKARDIEIAQRAVDRVPLYQPVYPLPAHAARLESYAFVLGYAAHATAR